MTKIISIHEYTLKPEVSEAQLKDAIQHALDRHLLQLPGLVEVHFLYGIKGKHSGQFTALWIYESREAWEQLWGSPEQPRSKVDYPEIWKIWEDEILAPLLDRDPDQIDYTTYEAISSRRM
jgi:hypothetical protein